MGKQLDHSLYLGYFTIGFISTIIGAMLPAIQAEIQISYGQAGLLLTSMLPGIIFSILVGGVLSDKYGTKTLLMAGGVALCLGLLGSMVSSGYLALFTCMVLSGVGFGAYDIGINVLCSVSNDFQRGNSLNVLHFFYGLGAIFGPAVTALCLRLFGSWRLVFGLTVILPLSVMLMLQPIKIAKEHRDDLSGVKTSMKNQLLWVCAFLIFTYVGIEVSIQGWIAAFWEKIGPNGFIPASLLVSLFWGALTLGRLVSGKVADRLGLARFLTIVSLGSMGLTLIWVFSYSFWSTLVLVFSLGLLLAGIFPTQLALTTSFFPGMTGMVTAFISGIGAIGALVIPSVIGKLADGVGILQLPRIITVLVLVMLIFAKYQEKFITGD